MDLDGRAAAVESLLQQPVRRDRPVPDAPLAFLLAAFLIGNPVPRAFQVALLHAFEEAEQRKARRAWIVHVFYSRGVLDKPSDPG